MNQADSTSPFPSKLRENVDSLAMAILMAIALKYFLIEAFQIPTPSMQPTLMGSVDMGVHDRILVDKSAYVLGEPDRWHVAVFRYPHNQSQNYVKRIVGLPGEKLRIIDGDIWRNEEGTWRPLRKPEKLQNVLWKPVYAQSDDDRLDDTFSFATALGRWTDDGSGSVKVVASDGRARSSFMPREEPRDHYAHSYPKNLHSMIPANARGGDEVVADLDWRLTIAPEGKFDRADLTWRQGLRGGAAIAFRLVIDSKAGKAQLEYFAKAQDLADGKKATKTSQLDGISTSGPWDLRVSNWDDQLAGSVDGEAFERIEYTSQALTTEAVSLGIDLHGSATIRDCSLARDGLYGRPAEGPSHIFEVPKDHFWMLGDNSPRSDDGRSWQELTIWAKDGKLVGRGEGEPIVGNARLITPLDQKPDVDENPVIVPSRKKLVMTDLRGNEHVLDCDPKTIGEQFDRARRDHAAPLDAMPWARATGAGTARFVPKQFFLGRGFLIFWPANPFSWFRAGLIR